MKLKSVTFRCSDSLLNRVENAMSARQIENRTDLISQALAEFLDFAEKDEVRQLDLFGLVEKIDKIGSRHRFSHHT